MPIQALDDIFYAMQHPINSIAGTWNETMGHFRPGGYQPQAPQPAAAAQPPTGFGITQAPAPMAPAAAPAPLYDQAYYQQAQPHQQLAQPMAQPLPQPIPQPAAPRPITSSGPGDTVTGTNYIRNEPEVPAGMISDEDSLKLKTKAGQLQYLNQ